MKREPRPKCVACGRAFRPVTDEPIHSQACAKLLLLRILASVPGVVDLLPPEWRKDIDASKRGKRGGVVEPHRIADREAKSAPFYQPSEAPR